MSDKPTDIPAFPVKRPDGLFSAGMTLRDWFAGQALTGLLAGRPYSDCGPRGYAHDAYAYADFMLAQRAQQKDSGDE